MQNLLLSPRAASLPKPKSALKREAFEKIVEWEAVDHQPQPVEHIMQAEPWSVPVQVQAQPPVQAPVPSISSRPPQPAVQPSPPFSQDLIIGALNAVIGIPVMLSFATIIFRHPFFTPYLSVLSKMVFLSSALHQIAFVTWSSMPYAVGQVQDVGLIILSAMASDVVDYCSLLGLSAPSTLASVLGTLTLSTAIAGVVIVGTGLLKLASLVQYCPLPVVGGYLAYVGWFCIVSGVGLAANVEMNGSLQSFKELFKPHVALRLAPALGMMVLLSLVQRRSKSPFALPALLISIPVMFYAIIFLSGCWSLQDLRDGGWMEKIRPEDSEWRFWKLYSVYSPSTFPWDSFFTSTVPRQLAKLAGLFFVVAFGSSMDIAAIQTESPVDVDYNSELVTVVRYYVVPSSKRFQSLTTNFVSPLHFPFSVQGLSNVVVGCAGVGFTGSYIFSQTLFSLRMGVSTPVMGTIIALAELFVFVLPINVLAYIPKFYFGALVIWIGYDIAKDWLFIAAKKVSPIEFVLIILTFAAVTAFGLEAGIAAGIVGAALHFAYEYAQVSVKAFTVVPSRSNAVRTFQQRLVLEAFGGRIAAVALSGMIFFGSATKCVDQILSVASSLLEPQPHVYGTAFLGAGGEAGGDGYARERQEDERVTPLSFLRTVPSERTLSETYDRLDALKSGSKKGFAAVASALQASPLILLLDLSRVHGIDATAARNFLTLSSRLAVRGGIRLIMTGLRPNETGRRIRRLLGGQGLTMVHPTSAGSPSLSYDPSSCLCFTSMDEGLTWCEDHFLTIAESYGVCEPRPERVDLAFVLRNNLQPPPLTTENHADHAAAAVILERVSEFRKLEPGSVVFRRGEPSNMVFIVRSGAILCQVDFTRTTTHSRAVAAAVPKGLAVEGVSRRLSYGAGGIVGDSDFMLQRPRSFDAWACPERGAECWVFDHKIFQRLSVDSPHVLVLLQTVMLRLNCLSASHALELLERTNI